MQVEKPEEEEIEEEIEEEVKEEKQEEEPEEEERDWDSEATRMGWADEDNWHGDPNAWVDAKTFVENGEKILPIVRAEKRRLEEEVTNLKRREKERDERFDKYHKHQTALLELEKKRRNTALAMLKQQKKEAIDESDGELVVRIDDQIKELEDFELPELEETKPEKKQDDAKEHPDFRAWMSENSWYENDRRMRAVANDIADELQQSGTTLQGRPFLDAVAEQVKKEYSHKFQGTRRRKSAAVETGTRPVPRKKEKGYADLPDDVKKVCDGFVEDGLYKDSAEGRNQYAKEYYALGGD